MTYAKLNAALAEHGLMLLGGFHPKSDDTLPEDCQTLVLVGPKPDFWTTFETSPEWVDAQPDPMDRWSTRVLSQIAADNDAGTLFPFGGPPFLPFFTWALRSGQAWQSPVNLLVHATAGLMVSYRGALALRERIALPPAPEMPCATCAQPCLSACTPRALTSEGYDVPLCKAHISSELGLENKTLGCSVRRACPVSQSYARMEAQSAYHMRIFLGEGR